METVVVFKVDQKKMAVPVASVERVVWAVEITPYIEDARQSLASGVINVEGRIISVYDFRKLLTGVAPELSCDHQFMILTSGGSSVAVIVDSVEGVLHYSPDVFCAVQVSEKSFTSGFVRTDSELIVTIDTKVFFSEERIRAIAHAVKQNEFALEVPSRS